jgi:hypothetical protein
MLLLSPPQNETKTIDGKYGSSQVGSGIWMHSAGILRNTGTRQTWLPLIKEPEKIYMYGWLPSPNDLPDNVQHLLSFPLPSHFF